MRWHDWLLIALLALCGGPGVAGTLPDPILTPGAARPLSVQKICQTKWGSDRRAVTAAMRREVFKRYRLSGNDDASCGTDRNGRHCEVDHLVSRELGGADVLENLWPQPYGGEWSAVHKDRLENRLHREVCAGRLSLADAQAMIRTDWTAAYRRYYGEP